MLTTTFTGIPLRNPFLLASAPPTTTADMIERAFAAGWGGAVIKTLAQDEEAPLRNVTPRICAVRQGNRVLAFANNELGTMKTVDDWLQDMARLKERWPDRALVASMLYGGTPQEPQWRRVAAKCEQAGADALELNFSCPHGPAEEGGLARIADDMALMGRVLAWVRQSTRLPIWVKLPAYCRLHGAARVCQDGGAQAITAINTLNCLPGINIHTSRPFLAVDGAGAFAGLSGPAVKPIALRSVVMARQASNLAVSGVGGVSTWEDAAEFILAGAGTVQVCTEVMRRGYGIIESLCHGLEEWLTQREFSSLDAAIGQALPHVVSHRALSRKARVRAHVDAATCLSCGACAISCRDSGYQAIQWREGEIAAVTPHRCDGCGLCVEICPNGSITLHKDQSGAAPEPV